MRVTRRAQKALLLIEKDDGGDHDDDRDLMLAVYHLYLNRASLPRPWRHPSSGFVRALESGPKIIPAKNKCACVPVERQAPENKALSERRMTASFLSCFYLSRVGSLVLYSHVDY